MIGAITGPTFLNYLSWILRRRVPKNADEPFAVPDFPTREGLEEIGWAQQATVTLVSPKDGDVIGSRMVIQWEFKPAGEVNHIHLYLDGANPGPPFGTSMELTGLSNGPHTVRIIAANTRHQEVGPEASATVTVQGAAAPTTPLPAPRRSRAY